MQSAEKKNNNIKRHLKVINKHQYYLWKILSIHQIDQPKAAQKHQSNDQTTSISKGTYIPRVCLHFSALTPSSNTAQSNIKRGAKIVFTSKAMQCTIHEKLAHYLGLANATFAIFYNYRNQPVQIEE